MKLLKGLALAACAAIAIGAGGPGCNTISPGTAPLGHTLSDERALYTVEAAYFGALTAAEAAADNGLLVKNSPQAVKVAGYITEAHRALEAGRSAYKVGDATSMGGQLAAAQDFIVKAWALIPRKES